MPVSFTFSNFTRGIERHRHLSPPEDGAFYDAVNCYITPAHTVKKRPGLRRNALGTYAGAMGAVGFAGKIHTFYSGAAPGTTALVQPHKLIAPDGSGAALVRIHYAAPLAGYIYVVAEFAGNKVWHFYLDDVNVGLWAATHHYRPGARVAPTVESGLHFVATSVIGSQKWTKDIKIVAGTTIVQPKKANGYVYKATAVALPGGVANGYTGTAEPRWPKAIGGTVVENVTKSTIVTWNAGKHIANGQYMLPTRMAGQGIMYRASYTTSTGKNVNVTGEVEPEWPTGVGTTVQDKDVTWTVVSVVQITWTCISTNVTGGAEPAWPVTPGLTVVDGNVTWTAVGRNVADTSCPNTKQAIILAGKVWCLGTDNKTVAFCAAANARAWSTVSTVWNNATNYKVGDKIQDTDGNCQLCTDDGKSGDEDPVWNALVGGSTTDGTVTWKNIGIAAPEDAGFINIAVNAAGDTRPLALGAYRGSLVIFTESGFQLWQVDEDPTQNALLEAFEGAGTVFTRGSVNMYQDLFFLGLQGIRSMASTLDTSELQAGDAGMPIDPLVTALISSADTFTPQSLYLPGLGQYWLIINNQAFVLTAYPKLSVYSWTRYTFSWNVQYATILNGSLYLLADDNNFYLLDPTYFQDDTAGASAPFTVSLILPYMVVGRHTAFEPEATMGQTKIIRGVTVISNKPWNFQAGYNQADETQLTPVVAVGPEDREDGIVPVEVMCRAFSPQFTHAANEDQWLAAITTYYDPLKQLVG